MSRDGFKLSTDHRDGCWVLEDDEKWGFIVSDGAEYRDRIGRRNGGTAWTRFRCNDPDCPAVALVRWDTLATFVTEGVAPQEETPQ